MDLCLWYNELKTMAPRGCTRRGREPQETSPVSDSIVIPRDDPDNLKLCQKCGELKPSTRDYFYTHAGKWVPPCKECRKAYYSANRERRKRQVKEWRAAHPGYQKSWVEANKDHFREIQTMWVEANPDYHKDYRIAHRKERSEYSNNWRKANPEKSMAAVHRRRVRRLGNGGRFTKADLVEIRKAQTDKQGRLICWRCNQPIVGTPHLDHWIPLDKGGTNDAGNLHYMHATCNISKGAKHPYELGRLL